MTNWMTKKYVAEQAKISDKAALRCAIDHHKQMYDASKSELRKAMKAGKVNIGSTWCALCVQAYNAGLGCSICLFSKCNTFCSLEGWNEMDKARNLDGITNYPAFHAAQAKLISFMEKMYKELYNRNLRRPNYQGEKTMDIKEAYRVMQAACGIEEGDTVKVVKTSKKNEMGYRGLPTNNVGRVGAVEAIRDRDGIRLKGFRGVNWYPFFALELISKKPKEEPVMITLPSIDKSYSEAIIIEALREQSP